MWESTEVRKTYLDFFKAKGHALLPSFPLIPPAGDTTLWISAGMQPFKAEFAGIAKPVSPRITTCQKCVRADDIERVGHTTRHHTFFEMLGNFSFGDYFKEEAIAWAWELLTEKFKLDPQKLYVSVHTDDDDAAKIWSEKIGVKNTVVRLADNWWGPIGATGTCGPDTEIYYDRGPQFSCGKPDCRPGCENKNAAGVDCDRYIELWNLVFTMYHKDEEGKLHELPQKNIDTGAGLERITMVLQSIGNPGIQSPFDTDLFQGIINRIEFVKSATGVSLFARNIVADHIRAVTFMIAGGAVPSNEGRGYVLRRILRRAAVYLGKISEKTTLSNLVEPVVGTMGTIYPDLVERKSTIVEAVRQAEEEFKVTLSAGMEALWAGLKQMNIKLDGQDKKARVPGDILFRLHDERGLPFDLAKDILMNEGFEVDEAGFHREMEKQRERSRGTKTITDVMAQALDTQSKSVSATRFLGYESTSGRGKVTLLLKGSEAAQKLGQNEEGIAVLDETPFYAESGGQVGDTGTLKWSGGEAEVLDTQKNEGGTFLHKIRVVKGALETGAAVEAAVDAEKRTQIRKHHTATHLLHAALREVLGPHVQQAGSFVCDRYLRLDFSHPQSLTAEEMAKIEASVNEKSFTNVLVETRVTNQEEAKKLGALALFGEKYGDKVRVVLVNDFSRELCGGTHAASTGEIGPFVLVRESSIAKGVRRIEARAGKSAVEYIGQLQRLKSTLSDRLKADLPDLIPQFDSVLSDKQERDKEVRRLKGELAALRALSLAEKAEMVGDVRLLAAKVEADEKETFRAMADALKEKLRSGIVVLGGAVQDKVALVCGVTPDLVKQGFSAVEIIKQISKLVGGGGGGRSDMAEAGGKDPAGLDAALQEAKKLIALKSKITNRS